MRFSTAQCLIVSEVNRLVRHVVRVVSMLAVFSVYIPIVTRHSTATVISHQVCLVQLNQYQISCHCLVIFTQSIFTIFAEYCSRRCFTYFQTVEIWKSVVYTFVEKVCAPSTQAHTFSSLSFSRSWKVIFPSTQKPKLLRVSLNQWKMLLSTTSWYLVQATDNQWHTSRGLQVGVETLHFLPHKTPG